MPPAARITDMHVCPMVTGLVPHVGGPVAVGCPTVIIGMMPAARMGDMCVCAGPPDSIAKGSPTVLIGGMMAARMGDMTMHGGAITFGCPTVMIGEAGSGGASAGANAFGVAAVIAATVAAATVIAIVVVEQLMPETYSKSITLKGSADFRMKTRQSLDRLNATAAGKQVLKNLDDSGKSVEISETVDNNGYTTPTDPSNVYLNADGSANTGSGSTVQFNPSFQPNGSPNEVVLGHELIHAQHNAQGTKAVGNTGGTDNEELQTVGLPPYPASGTTENDLRGDLGLSKRTSY